VETVKAVRIYRVRRPGEAPVHCPAGSSDRPRAVLIADPTGGVDALDMMVQEGRYKPNKTA
jgi:hypothetical protein